MNKSNTGLSLLSGALLGAAAMYILDPEAGSRRRHAISAKTNDALRGTGDLVGDVLSQAQKVGADLISHAHDLSDHLSNHARAGAASAAQHLSDVSGQASDAHDAAVNRLKDLGGRAADLGNELLDRVRQAAGQSRDAAAQAGKSAQESTHSLRHRLAHAIDPDHDHPASHAAGYASAGLGAVSLGAAAMYFFDPAKGSERREYVANQIAKCVQETGQLCRLTGQYVTRLWRRSAPGASRPQRPQPLDGEQLVQRARARIGHLLSNPTQVQLMADSAGVLTLHGRISAAEQDRVLFELNNLPGVTQVVDHLEVERASEANNAVSEVSAPVH